MLPTLAALPFGSGAASTRDTIHTYTAINSPFTVTTEDVPGGMVRGTITQDGEQVGTYIARAGTEVDLVGSVSADGTSVLTDIGLKTVDASSYQQTVQMASEFAAGLQQVVAYAAEQGINYVIAPGETGDEESPGIADPGLTPSVYLNTESLTGPTATLAMAGTGSQPGYIWDSGCASIDTKKAPWHGCYQRWTVDDRQNGVWYSGDQSQATGHGTFWTALTYGKTEHRYNSDGLVVKWKPGSQQNAGNCHTVTMELQMEATKLTDQHQVCPEHIRPSINNQLFKAIWEGWNYGGAVEATAEVFSRAPDGRGNGHQYWIGRGSCTC